MEDKLINLEDMRSLFRKRLWIIIVVTALTTVLVIYKTRQMAPTDTCSMKFLVSTSDKILDNYSENEIEAYSKFMATFNEIMKVGDFLDDTLKKNKISKTSDQVKYAISYSVSTTAPIFTLNYTSSSTNEMEDILNAVCEKFEYEIKEIDSRVKVKILEEPTTYSSLPNKAKVILVAIAAGIIISIGIILFLDYIDDTIGKREELEKILPVPVLGDIPHHEREFERELRKCS